MTPQDWHGTAVVFAVVAWGLVFVVGFFGSRWEERTRNRIRNTALLCLSLSLGAGLMWLVTR